MRGDPLLSVSDEGDSLVFTDVLVAIEVSSMFVAMEDIEICSMI
jgi:hypothetical protein